jgi:hypothetical protein
MTRQHHEWGDVKRGARMNRHGVDLIEIFGDLEPGDQIAVSPSLPFFFPLAFK